MSMKKILGASGIIAVALFMATLTLPLGDLTSEQARALADVARKYTGDAMIPPCPPIVSS